MMFHADVLIVGGGPVGASLALALGNSGLDVMLVEARASSSADTRTLAVSRGTALHLVRLGVGMDALDATPIEIIHVSQRGGFGRTVLRAAELGIPALGYVATYAALAHALETALPDCGATSIFGAGVTGIRTTRTSAVAAVSRDDQTNEVSARLVVLADGGRGSVQSDWPDVRMIERDYGQSAVVAIVSSDPPASHMAYERFTPSGPAALLPCRGKYALVWTAAPAEASELCALETAAFLPRLQEHFGMGALRFIDASPRAAFPLLLRYAQSVTAERVALIGNAAQTLHPVAGQGFNLGMRDMAVLAGILRDTTRDAIGSSAMLGRYRSLRRMDARGGIAVTDFLARRFAGDNPLVSAGRGLGLAAMDMLPPARRWLARKMMFGMSS